MAKKIAVLGVTGHIGAQLAKRLVQKGIEVTGIARNAAKVKELGLEGIEFREGSITDVPFLTDVLQGKDAAFIMIPPNMTVADNLAYQQQAGEAIVEAIKASGIRNLVNLSSLGAEFESGTGPVMGVHYQEKRLNGLEGVNIIHLRPAYFFENVLANIPMIQVMGINGSPMRGDVHFPAIATADIAVVAAAYLERLDFEGKKVHVLLGPRDITMQEITKVLGQATGKSQLALCPVFLRRWFERDAASGNEPVNGRIIR